MTDDHDIDARVRAVLDGLGLPYEIMDIDPDFADTAAFCEKLKAAGNRCELHSFAGGHFRSGDEWRTITAQTDEFLSSLGLLPAAR